MYEYVEYKRWFCCVDLDCFFLTVYSDSDDDRYPDFQLRGPNYTHYNIYVEN